MMRTRNAGLRKREASARRSRRDRIDQAMCDLRFGLLSFGQQLAKRTQRTDAGCGPSRGEAAARRWLAPSQSRCTDMGSPVQSAVERRGLRRAVARSSPPQAGGFGPPTSAMSSHAASLTASCCIITRLIGTQLANRRELRAFAGRSCGPPHLRAIPFRPSARGLLRDAVLSHEFASEAEHAEELPRKTPFQRGLLRAATHTLSLIHI